MKLSVLFTLSLFTLSLLLLGNLANGEEATPTVKNQIHTRQECQVWYRELSFANSVERHDAKAFLEHIDADAVFIGGDGSYTFGSANVAKDWAGIIEGKNIILGWHPDFVSISSNGKTAISRGPYWIEDTDPNSKQKFMIGTFQSTWVKDRKGDWHVFSDGGPPGPVPATLEQVEALKKSFSPICLESEW